MTEFFNSFSFWLLVVSVIAAIAITYSVISYYRNRKLRKEVIEWKIGRETDQPSDYGAFIDFFEQYSNLGGNTEEEFLGYASNSFGKRIQKSKSLSDLAKIFSGFRSDQLLLVETLHKQIKRENKEKVLSIAEEEWEKLSTKKLSIEQLNSFQESVKADWCREYELSEIFYERIKQRRQEITGKN